MAGRQADKSGDNVGRAVTVTVSVMASDPAEGRSASTQRSTVAGDAKPMSLEYDMRDRTHATRRARSAHY